MEMAVYYFLLIGLGIADIRSMVKAKLKKEIVPYLFLTVLAGVLGAFYFIAPDIGLAQILMDLVGLKR